MKHTLIALAAALPLLAHATGTPTPDPTPTSTSSSSAGAASLASSKAQAGAVSAIDLSLAVNPTAAGGAGGIGYGGAGGYASGGAGGLGGAGGNGTGGDSSIRQGNTYALATGATATPLPSGLCPKGDSFYLQVLGGFLFTYATSSTRTELECLERVLAAWKAHVPAAPAAQAPVSYIPPAPPIVVQVPVPVPAAAPAACDALPVAPRVATKKKAPAARSCTP